MMPRRVESSERKGTRSSSWKVIPQAPSSASLCTASIGSRGPRLSSPNWSRACQPTVQSTKAKRSSGVGCTAMVFTSENCGCELGQSIKRLAHKHLFNEHTISLEYGQWRVRAEIIVHKRQRKCHGGGAASIDSRTQLGSGFAHDSARRRAHEPRPGRRTNWPNPRYRFNAG